MRRPGKYTLLDAARARRRGGAAEGRSGRPARAGQREARNRDQSARRGRLAAAGRERRARSGDSGSADATASRRFCCSIAAGTRRSCSAASAATSRRVPTARSASRTIARPSGWSATTASTPKPQRTQCPRCRGVLLRQRGLGTQQVERLLADRFPSARIARMDVDTTSGKWAHAEILDRVGARRGRHPARHADDRQGFRLSECDARRRGRRGRRHQPAGLSRVGAVLSAPEPGRRARRSRAEGRARADSDARAAASRRAVRRRARLSPVRRAGARGPRDAGVSAERAPREHRVQRHDRGRDGEARDARRRRGCTRCCESGRCRASRSSGRRRVRSSGSRTAGAGTC